MAHTTALAAARHKLLADRGWDVEKRGLAGAPRLRILTTQNRHESILRSARLLGIGTEAIDDVGADNSGRIEIGKLEAALRAAGRDPVIVWLQAGDLNTGVFDPFARACPLAHAGEGLGAYRRRLRPLGRDKRPPSPLARRRRTGGIPGRRMGTNG